MVAEVSAEIGFPVGESITYGFINMLEYGFTWIISFTLSMLVNPLLPDEEQQKEKRRYVGFYIFLLITFAIATVVAIYLTFNRDLILHRYIEDKIMPEEENEENLQGPSNTS